MTNIVIPQDQTALANPKKTKNMRELGAIDISGIQQDIIDIPEISIAPNSRIFLVVLGLASAV